MDENNQDLNVTVTEVTISVIIPVYNGAAFLEECLDSVLKQEICPDFQNGSSFQSIIMSIDLHIELSIYDDASTDESPEMIEAWAKKIRDIPCQDQPRTKPRFSMKLGRNTSGKPQGAGFAKNRSIEQSTGEYLCFCDADDIMMPSRIFKQYQEALKDQNSLVGSTFIRLPEDSTRTFTNWINGLNHSQLYSQIYQSFGPPLLMPTWFCHRSVFNRIPGGLPELGLGMPEDIIFYYQHLDAGGTLSRVDEPLIVYRYHKHSTTFTISQETIWKLRLERLQSHVLSTWPKFTIWNAGRLGRRFYRSLSLENRRKVEAFCDVDMKKINQKSYHAYPLDEVIPIVHFQNAQPPFIICVKTDLTIDENGPFMQNLKSLSLAEGVDYFYCN